MVNNKNIDRTELSDFLDSIENENYVGEFKPCLITRSIYKRNNNRFEIDDTSGGWSTARVDKDTLIDLLMGNKEYIDLNWR
jgi:hypothetical protein